MVSWVSFNDFTLSNKVLIKVIADNLVLWEVSTIYFSNPLITSKIDIVLVFNYKIKVFNEFVLFSSSLICYSNSSVKFPSDKNSMFIIFLILILDIVKLL